MYQLGSALTRVSSPDGDVRRRGRLLIIINLGMAALALAFIPVILATTRSVPALTTVIVAVLVFLGVVLLGRTGHVMAGAYLQIGVTVLAIAASIPSPSGSANTPFYTVLAVLFAGALLPPAHVWGVLALSVAGIAVGGTLLPAEVWAEQQWRQGLLGAPLLLSMVALITFLSARATAEALREAQRARGEAEEASQALAASNAVLEARVEDRTVALRQIADEQRAIAGQLKASLDAQQELNRVIAELSVPIIPISDGTLVVPLVGNIDSARTNQLLAAVLARVEESGARTVVLDVTGVAVVDTQVAAALLRVADAARLMGAEALLVGIRPEVAQALVHLGVNLAALRTAATLADGLVAIGATSRR